MRVSWEIFGSALVVLGDFNPAIFSPDWLERNELIGARDAEAARSDKNLVVAHQAAGFSADWFAIQVLDTRLVLNSVGAVTPSIRDLAVGIFTLLPHVPISAMGLNFMAHYRIQDRDTWHLIGDTLAPKELWNQLFPGPKRATGMERLTIRVDPCERNEKPTNEDRITFTVEPSKRVDQGIFFNYNAHWDIASRASVVRSSAEVVTELVREEFELTWKEAIVKFDEVLALASTGKV